MCCKISLIFDMDRLHQTDVKRSYKTNFEIFSNVMLTTIEIPTDCSLYVYKRWAYGKYIFIFIKFKYTGQDFIQYRLSAL